MGMCGLVYIGTFVCVYLFLNRQSCSYCICICQLSERPVSQGYYCYQHMICFVHVYGRVRCARECFLELYFLAYLAEMVASATSAASAGKEKEENCSINEN